MKQYVGYSELRTRRQCPYKGHLSYDRRLTPNVKAPGLREGSIMDAGLNALYEGLKTTGRYTASWMHAAMKEAFENEIARIEERTRLMDEELEAMSAQYELLLEVARGYVDFAESADQGITIVTRQYQGEVPVRTPSGRASTRYQYRFKPDGLVVRDGQLWVWEDKAWKTIPQPSIQMLAMDEQCGMYLWGIREQHLRGELTGDVAAAVEECGLPVGVIYNILRKKTPVIPDVLKNGTTSQRKDMDTTLNVYLQTLLSRGQDPADYEDTLAVLRAKGNTFFVRHEVLRNDRELDEIGDRIYQACQIISQRHIYKVISRDCLQCQFYPYCLEPSDDILDGLYHVREHVHEQYEGGKV